MGQIWPITRERGLVVLAGIYYWQHTHLRFTDNNITEMKLWDQLSFPMLNSIFCPSKKKKKKY